MGMDSGIKWTDATYNHWIGCTKVGPGCDHCYAADWDARFAGGDGVAPHWGAGAPRRLTSVQNRNNLARWNRKAHETGKYWVFCSSLADVFDNEVPSEWRDEFWSKVRDAKNLRFQLVTKRIGNAARMLPADWEENFGHVGLIATIVNEVEAKRDMAKLRDTPAAWRGVSYEPALGPVDWDAYADWLDWLIVGGESGPHARDFNPAWAEAAIVFGRRFDVPVFIKQMGARPIGMDLMDDAGGNWDEWPEGLRVREMPRNYPELFHEVGSVPAIEHHSA